MNTKRLYLLPLIAVVALFLGGTVAQANTLYYSFDFATANAVNPVGALFGGGVFDVDSTTNTIVGITGSDLYLGVTDLGPMTLLNPGAFASNDNAFTNNSPYFTENGLSFSNSGGVNYNIAWYATAAGYGVTGDCNVGDTCITDVPQGNPSAQINFTANVVQGGNDGTAPEPASMLLLGTGLLGLSIFGKKRFAK
jgi:hypothetical protein